MDLVKQYSMDFGSEIGACIIEKMRILVLNVLIDNSGNYNVVFEDGDDVTGFRNHIMGK